MVSDHYLQDPTTLDYSHRLYVAGMCCALVVYLITFGYWAWVYSIFKKAVGLALEAVGTAGMKGTSADFDFLVFTFTKVSPPSLSLVVFVSL